MAYTTPMTAVTGATFTAAQYNTYVRDNDIAIYNMAIEPRYMGFLLNTTVALSAGDDAVRFRIPSTLNGWRISSVAASRKSGTGTPTIQIRNVTDTVDVLSTRLTIDSGETDSSTAATPAVINTSNDDVATADQFAWDVDVSGTSTLYAYTEITFAHP